jgi:hypothetical protein
MHPGIYLRALAKLSGIKSTHTLYVKETTMKYKISYEARTGSNTTRSYFELESPTTPKVTDINVIELAMMNAPRTCGFNVTGITITSITPLDNQQT